MRSTSSPASLSSRATSAGTLTVIPAYRKATLDYFSVLPGFIIDQYTNATFYDQPARDLTETDEQTSFEARFASPTDRRFNWILGTYYMDEDIDYIPVYHQVFNASYQNVFLTTTTWALFGHASYSLSDTVRLTAGARYRMPARRRCRGWSWSCSSWRPTPRCWRRK